MARYVVKDYPFLQPSRSVDPWPALWIRLSNSHIPDKHVTVLAYVDTGAENSTFDGRLALRLGHDLKEGKQLPSWGAHAAGFAYEHKCTIDILDSNRRNGTPAQKTLYKGKPVVVQFLNGPCPPLLGYKDFLANFIVQIDYPRKTTSLWIPD